MLLHRLLSDLGDSVDVIYIPNPSLSGREILYNICEELGLQAADTRPDTVRLLQNTLLERHTEGRRVVAFIDEAQAMPDESLEEIRLLSNLETSRDKLLQIVLFGQPEFEDKLSQQSMRQLRERITVWLKLKPFGRDDVREYIATRLRAAGHDGAQLFNNDACRLIAVVSQGLSRRINVLADKAMLSAFQRGALAVNYADVRRAVRDVNFGRMRYRTEHSKRFSRQLTVGVSIAAALLLTVAAGVRLSDDEGGEAPAVAAATPASAEAEVVAAEEEKVAALPVEEEATPPADDELEMAILADEESAAADAADFARPAGEPEVTFPDDNQTEAVAPAAGEAQAAMADSVPAPEPMVVIQTVVETVVQEAEPAPAAEPVVVIQTVVETVVQEATPAPAQRQEHGADGRQELMAAISAFNRGDVAFNGDDFAAQIAANAQHTDDAPQQQGGGADWQETAALAPALVDNAQWEWMPASSYLRNRLNATQTWLQEEGDSPAYTVRLITVSQERAVFLERFLRYFYDFYPIRNTMVYPLRLRRGDMFVVTFGVYPSRAEAEVFIRNVPYYFTGGKPFAQPLATSLAEAQRAWVKSP